MAFCNNCGKQLAEGAKFCPSCGTSVGAAAAQQTPQPAAQTEPQPAQQPAQPQPVQQPAQPQQASLQQQAENKFAAAMNNVADNTAQYDQKDIDGNKALSVLAYFGPLVLIPLLGAKESKFARFHCNQGIVLLIACIIYGIAYSVLSSIILAISWRLYFVVSILGLVGVVFTILAVIGIINAVNGKAKELPFIGKFKVLK